ncbi:hypothetical protein [uncultured Rubinisphaera sp.]|uniref:hypothetical protein n=1 Tax=uncultured Rubinisphaera sp. TaxID=1678686 RepID=UPI0030D8DCA4
MMIIHEFPNRFDFLFCLAVGTLLLGGCSNQSSEQNSPSPTAAPTKPLGPPPEGQTEPKVISDEETSMTHTIKMETEFYKTGPQQGSPPDGTLTAGINVRLVESSGSYSLIETADGEHVYVSSDALIENEGD